MIDLTNIEGFNVLQEHRFKSYASVLDFQAKTGLAVRRNLPMEIDESDYVYRPSPLILALAEELKSR